MSASFLKRDNGPDLAYRSQPGRSPAPTVLFLTGFRSDMEGTKAAYLAEKSKERDQKFIRFDYRGHGQSGGAFEDGTIGLWLEDALAVIDGLTQGPLVLVGSSMGGWIGLHCALARPGRVCGFIGLAAAPDFTRDISSKIGDEQKAALRQDGFFVLPNDYDTRPYIITQKLIEDGNRHCLLDSPIRLTCPVRLVQGMKDVDVPWQTAEKLKNAITGIDARIYYREDGDHRLSTSEDLSLIQSLVDEISADCMKG